MKTEKILHNKHTGMGAPIGKYAFTVNNRQYYVGDLVAFKDSHTGKPSAGLVALSQDGLLRICGAFMDEPEKIEPKKILPYNYLTPLLMNRVHDHYEVREVKVKQMTLTEIEDALGYKVEIVGND
ncbi:hypothetical protein AB3N02_21830 [Priestia aryabhattai]|uniref:hypothetical protein n=1 Tax=Priestia aryabhattai TaxID=412384 RepID=UPI0039A1CC9D